MKTQRITLPIDDLSCGGGGALVVERALARTPGVVYVYVNPATEMAYIVYDPALSDPDRLVKVVEHAGFRAGAPSMR
jgi:copper chaperone CopZ